jgi:hypothetical protein
MKNSFSVRTTIVDHASKLLHSRGISLSRIIFAVSVESESSKNLTPGASVFIDSARLTIESELIGFLEDK